jgi:thiamine biosynthesis lipoprotein
LPTWLCVVVATLLLVACEKDAQTYHTQFVAMGTVIDVSFWDVDPQRGDAAIGDIQALMNGVERRWHAWHPSELTTINAHLARGEKANLDAQALASLRKAAELSLASGNRFNPAIGQLIRLWGFASDEPPHGPPPPQGAIEDLLKYKVTMADLIFYPDGISSRNPALRLDLGGWAKTLALDGAVAHLRALGIANAIVNAGGDLRLFGSKGGKPWKIGIRNPRAAGILAAVEGRGDESVFTSGDYERFFEWEGVRYQHIIDPQTGHPATGIASATVIHPDTAVAEAGSKAVLIAGLNHWRDVAAKLGIDQVMLITDEMQVYLTQAMAERVRFVEEPPRKEIVR